MQSIHEHIHTINSFLCKKKKSNKKMTRKEKRSLSLFPVRLCLLFPFHPSPFCRATLLSFSIFLFFSLVRIVFVRPLLDFQSHQLELSVQFINELIYIFYLLHFEMLSKQMFFAEFIIFVFGSCCPNIEHCSQVCIHKSYRIASKKNRLMV